MLHYCTNFDVYFDWCKSDEFLRGRVAVSVRFAPWFASLWNTENEAYLLLPSRIKNAARFSAQGDSRTRSYAPGPDGALCQAPVIGSSSVLSICVHPTFFHLWRQIPKPSWRTRRTSILKSRTAIVMCDQLKQYDSWHSYWPASSCLWSRPVTNAWTIAATIKAANTVASLVFMMNAQMNIGKCSHSCLAPCRMYKWKKLFFVSQRHNKNC